MFVLPVMARTGGQLDKAHVLQGSTHRVLANAHAKLFMEPGNHFLDPPADDPMHGRDRSVLDDPRQSCAVVCRQLGHRTRGFAVNQHLRAFGVESQHPVQNNLKRDPADPGRLKALAAILDR